MTTIGVISDTHGLLRPEALAALRGSALLLHAGDIGSPEVLEQLQSIASVTAVRGNNDTATWSQHIPTTTRLTIERTTIYMLHDLKEFDLDPVSEDIQIVIAGHSHRPSIERRDGVLYLNPGSAGPRRFKLPISVATLEIDGATAQATLIDLQVGPAKGS